MLNKKFFYIIWSTIGFLVIASVAFGQINPSQQGAIAPKTDLGVRGAFPPDSKRVLLHAAPVQRTVAIITFENLSAFPENDWVGAGFAESLTTKLSKLESIDLYERRQLNGVLTASGLDQQRVSEKNWEKAEQIGSALHLKGVQSLLIGSVAMMGSYQNPDVPLQVNARTVNVETGAITKGEAFSVQGKFAQLFDLQTLLAQQFVIALGVKQTSEEEQRMKERETESLAAYRLYILGLQALDSGKYAEAKELFYEAYKPRNFPAAKEAFAIASEREVEEKEKSGVRDEAGRAEYARAAEADASRGAIDIYYLGRQRLFDGKYDEAIGAYQDFLKYTQKKVLRWKYQAKSTLSIDSLGHPFGRRQYPPVVSDGVVYIASALGVKPTSEDVDILYAIESLTGRLLWKTAMSASQPVVAGGKLYISDREKGILYALKAKSGEVIWKTDLGVRLGRNAVVTEDMVYVWSCNYKWMDKGPVCIRLYALSRSNGALMWEHDIGVRIGYSRPIAVAEGIVYFFSTAEPTWNKNGEYWDWADYSTLYALDGTNGTLLWRSEVRFAYSYIFDNFYPQIDYAPVVADGVLYAVEKHSPFMRGRLRALSGKDGKVLWRSEKRCTGYLPVIFNGVVCIPGGEGIYIFDAKNGALHGQIDIDKKVELDGVDYSVTMTDDTIYVRLSTRQLDPELGEPKSIYAFSSESGAKLWQYQVGEGIGSSFSVVGGILYFTDEDGNLYALDGKSGKLLWRHELVESALSKRYSRGTGNYSNPVVVDDLIYISAENTLYAFSVSGERSTPSDLDARVAIGRALWLKGDAQSAKTTLNAVVETKPNVSATWALLAEISEQLGEKADAIKNWQQVIDYASPLNEDYQKSLQHLGKLAGIRWHFKPYLSSAMTARQVTATKGKVYLGNYILESMTGRLLGQQEQSIVLPRLSEGMVYVYYDSRLHAIEAQNDSVRWTYDFPSEFSCSSLHALDENIIIMGYRIYLGKIYVPKTYALSKNNGKLLWEKGWQGGFPVGFDGVTYTFSEGSSMWGRRFQTLYAYSNKTGKLLWSYELPQHYPEEDSNNSLRFAPRLAVSEGTVYLVAGVSEPTGSGSREVGGVLFVLDRTKGTVLRKYNLGGYVNLETNSAGNVYADAKSYTLALDGRSGEILWKRDIGYNLVTENVIYGVSKDGLKAMDARSGDVLWTFKGYGEPIQLSELSEGVLYLFSMSGILYGLDATTGMPIWEYNMGYKDSRAWRFSAAVANGILYISTSDGSVYAIDIQQASVKLPPSPKLMAVNYLERGRYAEAVETCQKALAKDPKDASVLNILGKAYWKTGQTGKTLNAFQNVLRLEQKGDAAANAWSGISEISQSGIDSEIFLEFCNKLAGIAPEDAEFQVRLRLLLYEFHRSGGDLKAAEKEYAKTGFPKESSWLVIGPFDNTDDKGRTYPYPPETEINTNATYQGKTGTVQWQKSDDGQMNGRLDFTKIFTPTEWVVAYALIEVISPDDREAQLRIGSDDGIKVWLNGQVVWTNQVPRGLRLDEDVAPIALRKGTNRLLFKVDNGVVAWEFTGRITDANGQPLEELQYVPAR